MDVLELTPEAEELAAGMNATYDDPAVLDRIIAAAEAAEAE